MTSEDVKVGRSYRHAEGEIVIVDAMPYLWIAENSWTVGVTYHSDGQPDGMRHYTRPISSFCDRFSLA